MTKVGFDANFSRLNTKKLKSNVVYFFRCYSEYDQETKQRKILKTQASGRKIANVVKDANKDNAATSIKIMKEQGLIREEGKYYIIEDMQKESFRNIDKEFAKELIKTRNSETVMTYVWMHRKLDMCRKQGKPCYFTYKDILKGVFNKDYWSGQEDKKISRIIADLTASGLITYNICKFVNELDGSFTFIRQLTGVYEKFRVIDAIEKHDRDIVGKENLMIEGDISDNLVLSDAVVETGFLLE